MDLVVTDSFRLLGAAARNHDPGLVLVFGEPMSGSFLAWKNRTARVVTPEGMKCVIRIGEVREIGGVVSVFIANTDRTPPVGTIMTIDD